jgi:uncharacterized membrane protein YfcA
VVELSIVLLIALSFVTALIGTLGGLGGAIILVPVLVLLGVDAQHAAPLGILSVAAGSLAAAPRHLDDGVVHHRLGVTLEITASAGAIVGALLGGLVSSTALARVLAVVALLAAISGVRRRGLRNPPRAEFSLEEPGEWPGTLSGAYRLSPTEIVPYSAKRVPAGLVAMALAGLVSGLAGIGGGFIKTPAMNQILTVPVRVAAATSTFTVGITAAASLLVFSGQGRIDYRAGAAIVVGGVLGGVVGARVGRHLHPELIRRVLTVALLAISVILVVTG